MVFIRINLTLCDHQEFSITWNVLESDAASTGSMDSWYRDFNKFNFDSTNSAYVCKVKNGPSGTEISSGLYNLELTLLSE